ncbi:MAG: hypothetical protein HZC40_19235 [Chloroflexi bacterium]|nr:hypothetical protein [Chloroflexota bacterium]
MQKIKSSPSKTSQRSLAYKTFLARESEFRGKYVVIVGTRVFTAKTGAQASRLLTKVRKNFPGKTPLATFWPKEGTLILWQ